MKTLRPYAPVEGGFSDGTIGITPAQVDLIRLLAAVAVEDFLREGEIDHELAQLDGSEIHEATDPISNYLPGSVP